MLDNAPEGSPLQGSTPFPTKPQLKRINREFVAMVRSWFPRKFYEKRAGQHNTFIAAALLRMCDMLDALMVLMTQAATDESARVLLRSLYEQAVRLSWVLINPHEHHSLWVGQGQRDLLTIHNALMPYRTEFLTSEQLAWVQGAAEMPSVEEMTRQADKHWPAKVLGLHQRGHALSFHGLYVTVYRATSLAVHGSVNSLEPYFDLEGPWPVAHASVRDEMIIYALGAPLLGIALIVAGQDRPWIDEARVRRFVDRASAETTRRRERSARG
jgi:hypothetical protein